MFFSKKQTVIHWCGLAVIFITAWILQSHLLLENDDLWLLNAFNSLMHRGNYWRTFFETNPPLAILLYAPAALIEKLFGLNAILSLRIYFFLSAALSLTLCAPLFKKIFSASDSNVALTLLLSIAFVFLIVPEQSLGQREHLFFIFTTPYVFLAICRTDGKPIETRLAILIGVLSAIGFCIKPYFLAPFVLIESYVVWMHFRATHNRPALMRPEMLCVLLFIPFYLLITFLFFKLYLYKIIPITMIFYYDSIRSNWITLLTQSTTLFCLLSFVAYRLLLKKITRKNSVALLALWLLGNFITYLIQRSVWYYHILPEFSSAIIFDVFLLSCYVQSSWQREGLLATMAVSLFVFFYPLYLLANAYDYTLSMMISVKPLIHFFRKKTPNQSVFLITGDWPFMYSVFEYGHVTFDSHFQSLLWMRRYFQKNYFETMPEKEKKAAMTLTNLYASDIEIKKPALIFVNRSCDGSDGTNCLKVPYLQDLKKSNDFRTAWNHYHFAFTVYVHNFFTYDVYARAINSPSCKDFPATTAESKLTLFCSNNKITVDPSRK